jgi:biotin operon repressor
MARDNPMDAVMKVLSYDEGVEIEEICNKARVSESAVWRVIGMLRKDGMVEVSGSRKTGKGKRFLYVLVRDAVPPDDPDFPCPTLERIKSGGFAERFGAFSTIIAQVACV